MERTPPPASHGTGRGPQRACTPSCTAEGHYPATPARPGGALRATAAYRRHSGRVRWIRTGRHRSSTGEGAASRRHSRRVPAPARDCNGTGTGGGAKTAHETGTTFVSWPHTGRRSRALERRAKMPRPSGSVNSPRSRHPGRLDCIPVNGLRRMRRSSQRGEEEQSDGHGRAKGESTMKQAKETGRAMACAVLVLMAGAACAQPAGTKFRIARSARRWWWCR